MPKVLAGSHEGNGRRGPGRNPNDAQATSADGLQIRDYDIDIGRRDCKNVVMTVKGEVQTPQALGRAIQQARALRGLSQRELAGQLGISQRWLWELEQGKPGIFTERLFEVLRAVDARLLVEVAEPEPEIPDSAESQPSPEPEEGE